MTTSFPTEVEAPAEVWAAAEQLAGQPALALEPIGGGRNSRVYRLTAAGGQHFALKAYFRHAADTRDRLGTEFSSMRFMWENGVRDIPEPLAANREMGCALYGYMDGQKISSQEVTDTEIDAALSFLGRLKELRGRAGSVRLGAASEACFSVEAIVRNVRRRLSRFTDEGGQAPLDSGLRAFLAGQFVPSFERITRWCQATLAEADLSFADELEPGERTLSPSDFGFHNALRCAGGQLVFLDFEYFGWDDPAKMAVDVLLHPGMNLSLRLKRHFAGGLLERFSDFSRLANRIVVVYPLFGLKWCLILLNEFLPDLWLRRQFAALDRARQSEVQAQQLAKAQTMFEKLLEDYEHFPYFS